MELKSKNGMTPKEWAEFMTAGMSDEELDNFIAQLDFDIFASDFHKLHVAFLEAQAIVMQVKWGKDAIKEAVLKTS